MQARHGPGASRARHPRQHKHRAPAPVQFRRRSLICRACNAVPCSPHKPRRRRWFSKATSLNSNTNGLNPPSLPGQCATNAPSGIDFSPGTAPAATGLVLFQAAWVDVPRPAGPHACGERPRAAICIPIRAVQSTHKHPRFSAARLPMGSSAGRGVAIASARAHPKQGTPVCCGLHAIVYSCAIVQITSTIVYYCIASRGLMISELFITKTR